jgi:uncharacterized protein (TIGR04255 family)
MALQFSQYPSCRLQILNEDQSRLIQVQNGRFHYNWIKTEGQPYPRFSILRPEFDDYFAKFQSFVEAEGEGKWVLNVNQWEVTYVNHVPKGSVWSNPDGWPSVFPMLTHSGTRIDIGDFESFEGEWQYVLPSKRGRLHVNLKHGKLKQGKLGKKKESDQDQEVLIFTLTARGPVGKDSFDLSQGLELGRNAIVRAFFEMTSESAHEYWGVRHGS